MQKRKDLLILTLPILIGSFGLKNTNYNQKTIAKPQYSVSKDEAKLDCQTQMGPVTNPYTGNYYKDVEGSSGLTLMNSLHSLIKQHTTISYDNLFDVYEDSDMRLDGTVWDWYGDISFNINNHSGSYSKVGDMYNREHSVPKSYFNEKSPMISDAFHVIPTDGYVNNRRSNYVLGEVSTASYSYTFNNYLSGTHKVGSSSINGYSGTVFEPADCYKGDFARIYFYFATCYKDKFSGFSNNNFKALFSTDTTNNFYLTDYSKALLLKWHRNDPVSQREVNRCNAVYSHQGNRNPFVDNPNYVEAIWGNTPLQEIAPTTLTMSTQAATIIVGETLQLTATPNTGASKSVTWSSSNNDVAIVDNNGLVTTKNAGSAVIFAKSSLNQNISCSCSLTVKNPAVLVSLDVSGTPSKTHYFSGDSFNPSGLTITASYDDETSEIVTNLVTWNPSPLTEGTTSVTGTYKAKTITISGLIVEASRAAGETYTISIDSFTSLTSSYDWQQFTSGTLKGSAYIYGGQRSKMQFNQNKGDYCIFSTKALENGIQSIKLYANGAAKNWELFGSNTAFSTSNYATNGTSLGVQNVTTSGSSWTVNGAYKYFCAQVAESGATYLDKIEVVEVDATPLPQDINVTSISLSEINRVMRVGDKAKLIATITPANATNKNVVWESTNPSVVSVDQNGNISALSKGNATISVVTEDHGFIATCYVSVFDKEQEDNKNNGCGGSLISSSALISLLSIIGALLIKKRRNE